MLLARGWKYEGCLVVVWQDNLAFVNTVRRYHCAIHSQLNDTYYFPRFPTMKQLRDKAVDPDLNSLFHLESS